MEPNDDDCNWPSDDEDLDDATAALASTLREKAQLTASVTQKDEVAAGDTPATESGVATNGAGNDNSNQEKKNSESNTIAEVAASGVEDFWLIVLKNVDIIAEMIQEHDEPILKHLQDIRVQLLAGNESVMFIG